MQEDLQKIADNFKSFNAVVAMVTHAVTHGSDIFNDASSAATHFANHEMKDFGIDLGDIVRIVLIDKLETIISDAA